MKTRRKSKRQVHRRRMKLLFLECCGLAIMIAVISLFVTYYPFDLSKELSLLPSVIPGSNTDFHTGSIDNEENNAEESNADESNAGEIHTDENEWCLILVNKWNYIPDNYEVELTKLSGGESVDQRIYPKLQEMLDAARNDNIYPVVVSGYRTAEKQQRLMDEKIAEYEAEGCVAEEAITKADAWVAIPGTSEHQIGIGVDINADSIHSRGEDVYDWLEQNSYQFGFIRRYPAEKTEITGIINEPWHYRYVGVEAATEIHTQEICLEEYLNQA